MKEEKLSIRERLALASVQAPGRGPTCAISECSQQATRSLGRWTVCAEHALKIRRARCYDR